MGPRFGKPHTYLCLPHSTKSSQDADGTNVWLAASFDEHRCKLGQVVCTPNEIIRRRRHRSIDHFGCLSTGDDCVDRSVNLTFERHLHTLLVHYCRFDFHQPLSCSQISEVNSKQHHYSLNTLWERLRAAELVPGPTS
jgi:hypothetical protein